MPKEIPVKLNSYKVALVVLGCPRNEVDADCIKANLQNGGHQVTNPAQADIIIVNTCAFTRSAKQESINTILELAQHKRDGSCQALIVVGCLAQRYSSQLLELLPEVDAVLGLREGAHLSQLIGSVFKRKRFSLVSLPPTELLAQPRTAPEHPFAYLKISDGCNSSCSFCIIPQIRGAYRSCPIDSLRAEAEELVQSGAREIILAGQDITRYGLDLYNKPKLAELVTALASIDKLQWIRLLYLQPDQVNEELIVSLSNSTKVCPYLDIAFQHGSGKILKMMKRWGSTDKYLHLIKRIKQIWPEVVLRSSVIVGFPGESEADFKELVSFVKAAQFDYLGVFEYSAEEGTEAAKLPQKVSRKIVRKRYHQLTDLQDSIALKKNQSKIGKQFTVLIEKIDHSGGYKYEGRTRWQAPEIDGQVYITKGRAKVGKFKQVKISQVDLYDLIGEIVESS